MLAPLDLKRNLGDDVAVLLSKRVAIIVPLLPSCVCLPEAGTGKEIRETKRLSSMGYPMFNAPLSVLRAFSCCWAQILLE